MMQKLILLLTTFILLGCTTVDLQKQTMPEIAEEQVYQSAIEEQEALNAEYEEYMIEELVKETDVSTAVVIIEKPVYYPIEENKILPKQGATSVKEHLDAVTQVPQFESGRLRKYDYHEDFVYEIHCQTYHTTDIQLEPGEEVLETPFLSETEVWELGAGVSYQDGLPRQHFFIKPNFTNLISTMTIITNRRVYHLELKSFSDYYMPIVRWTYPERLTYNIYSSNNDNQLHSGLTFINPEYLSFDYKMTFSIFNKPIWLPIQVYDDGQKTYIVLDKQVMHMEKPTLFNEKNEIINYRVQEHIFIVDQLINKATLRIENQWVRLEKKKTAKKTQEAVYEQ
jgi:type IV secretion system protein VirB9